MRVSAQTSSIPDWARLRDETLRHFQAVLRLDTSNPPGSEYLVTDYIKSMLDKEGIAVGFALDPETPESGRAAEGSRRRQPILFMGHSDVVTVDPKKWTFPPFSATRDGAYIYRRARSTTSHTWSPV